MGYSIFDETMVDMTWPEIERAAKDGATVLLPIGIIEEHGPHMGLAVDTYIAYLISVQTKHLLESTGIVTLIAPPQYWGVSAGTATFGGTFSVREGTLKALVYDIIMSLHGWRLKKVFAVNFHGDYLHSKAILEAVQEARRDIDTDVRYVLAEFVLKWLKLTGAEDYVLVQKNAPSTGEPKKYIDLHAGSLETGIMAEYFPGQVDIEMAKRLPATELTYEDLRGLGKSDAETRRLIPRGYFGDPASFDTGAARLFIEATAQSYAEAIAGYIKGK
jgi:creatinine amidohydrolase